MPDLGNKYECYSCGAKFYDLGKAAPICPKCGANQKDAAPTPPAYDAASARRRRKEELVRRVSDEAETAEEGEKEDRGEEREAAEGEREEKSDEERGESEE